MVKYLLSIILVTTMTVSCPIKAMANQFAEIEFIDNGSLQKTDISIDGNVLRVTDGAGQTMRIYNVAGGAPVMIVKIDGQDKRFDLNLAKGIYIVKVGKVARKIVIK